MKYLLKLKHQVFKEGYPKHLELFKKETGIELDVEDVHTFARYEQWFKRRVEDATKATCIADSLFTDLGHIAYRESLNFEDGLCIDPKNQNIYFPSDGSDTDGHLFHLDPYKSSGELSDFLETDPEACEMIRRARAKVDEMKEQYEYDEFVRKYSAE